jgi:CheY-like chemotaxis protein
MGQAQPNRRLAFVVEDDADLRWLMTSLFEETEFEVIGMKSAEVALATMLLRGRDVGIIFADIQLSGVMDGIDLAREAKMRWPHLTIILTSGSASERLRDLPPDVHYIRKPWQPLNVIVAAERAKSAGRSR